MYFTVQELMGKPGMPEGERNVRIKLSKIATDEHKRKREVSSGRKPMEFHIDCLPAETRMALMQQIAKEEADKSQSAETREMSSAELWYEFDLATDKQKERATVAHELCVRVRTYVDDGMNQREAMRKVADEAGCSFGRIHRYFYNSPGLRINRIPKNDWLPALLDGRGGATRTADMPDEAWELFKADYLRPEMKSGTFTEVYRRLSRIAEARGWELPCLGTFKNRVKRDIPKELVLLKRFGLAEFQQTVIPAQRRSRKGLHAMQVVAGDGHKCRVFCKRNGKVFRPVIWAFIDVYSSMIVGYSVDISENTEMLGLAVYNMVSKYHAPTQYIFDRGSVLLSEAMTGRMSRPKRDGSGKLVHKKFDAYEIEGALTAMGSTVNWIRRYDDNEGSKGNSRANPIERLWHSKGGFGQFEREPVFDEAYTGANIDDKPANYNENNAVDYDVFLEHLDAWIHRWNHEEGRRTEMAKSRKLSYAQVFKESYEQSEIPKPTQEQLALCLLRTRKAVKVHEGGLVDLNAGDYSNHETNRYRSPLLFEYVGSKVMLRFNPYDLTQYVLAYSEDGRFIGKIPLYGDVAVNDLSAPRHKRLMEESEVERVENIASVMITKTVDDLVEAYALQEHEKTDIGGPVPGITKMVPSMPRTLDDFSDFDMGEKTKRAVGHDASWDADDDYFNDDMTRVIQQQFGKNTE
ncbi:TPA: transposase domain-containing protein [Vibrio parahaemolyticus]|uniref:transposase domain-containing protein n=1 Tax=Vibrio parahaemolyticus TaxID=670 RepID=UPI000411B165|nr:transposase domain-containing protein [Vibrio parahaemolyticus]